VATYYLKADDKQSLYEALEAANLATRDYDLTDANNQRPTDLAPEDEWTPSGAYKWRLLTPTLDEIGVLTEPTGTMLVDDDGHEYPETQQKAGYHANLQANLNTEQKAVLPIMRPAPKNPVRKWAGEE